MSGWREPALQMGAGAMLCSAALAVPGDRDLLAGGFLLAGVFLVLSHAFGSRLVRAKLDLGVAGGAEFELAEDARDVTTAIASTPEPVAEVGPDEADDATRWWLAEMLLAQLLVQPLAPVDDCRFQLYLHDPDRDLLMPILDPGHPGPSPGFAPYQGTVGEAWATGDYVLATGPAVSDDTFRLTPEQKHRYADVTVVTAVPVTNAGGRVIGVVSGSSRAQASVLATDEGLDVQIFLAEATSRILVDLLKWFSDGYDENGGREAPWQARSSGER